MQRRRIVDRDYDRAAGLYLEAMQMASPATAARAQFGLARSLNQTGNEARAIEVYREILEDILVAKHTL